MEISDSNKVFLSKIDRMIVPLGLKCNLSCKYCIQHLNVKNNFFYEESLTDDFVDFLVFWSKISKINKNRLIAQKPILVLYGGEPLLYFGKIRKLIVGLEHKGFDFNKINIKVLSNITLLTQEMVDFFNSYKISVAFSTDGYGSDISRSEFPDSKQIKLWEQIDNRYVSLVVNANNYDFVKNILYIKRTYGVDKICATFIDVNSDIDRDLYNIGLPNLKKMFANILLYYSSHNLDWAFLSFFKEKFPDLILDGKYKTLTVDTAGNIGLNRFYNKKSGTIYDDILDILKNNKDFFSSHLIDSCLSCSYNDICFIKNYLFTMKNKNPLYYCQYYQDYMKVLEENKFAIAELIEKYRYKVLDF